MAKLKTQRVPFPVAKIPHMTLSEAITFAKSWAGKNLDNSCIAILRDDPKEITYCFNAKNVIGIEDSHFNYGEFIRKLPINPMNKSLDRFYSFYAQKKVNELPYLSTMGYNFVYPVKANDPYNVRSEDIKSKLIMSRTSFLIMINDPDYSGGGIHYNAYVMIFEKINNYYGEQLCSLPRFINPNFNNKLLEKPTLSLRKDVGRILGNHHFSKKQKLTLRHICGRLSDTDIQKIENIGENGLEYRKRSLRKKGKFLLGESYIDLYRFADYCNNMYLLEL